MQLYGLVGKKLGHSFSRSFFQDKFKTDGISADYLNFEMPSVDDETCGIKAVITKHPELRGFNVTIPYKKDIIALLDKIDPVAKRIGAVNTVKLVHTEKGIRLEGYNTDIIGFNDSIKPLLQPDTKRKVLILGTGGASLAVCCAMEDLGFRHTRVSRTKSTDIVTYDELWNDPAIIADTGIIINCTPLGMWPDIDTEPDIPYSRLRDDQILYDLVYNPDPTKFMRSGMEQGCKVCSGRAMLIGQALASWNIWQK